MYNNKKNALQCEFENNDFVFTPAYFETIKSEIIENDCNNNCSILSSFINKNPLNNNLSDIYAKIAMINCMTPSNVRNKDFYTIANILYEFKDFDKKLNNKDIELIEEFNSLIKKTIGKNYISFCSKYIVFHEYFLSNKKSQEYSIYDSVIRGFLNKYVIKKHITKENGSKYNLSSYKDVYDLIGNILNKIWQSKNGLNKENFGRKDFDLFIWGLYNK